MKTQDDLSPPKSLADTTSLTFDDPSLEFDFVSCVTHSNMFAMKHA